MGLIETTLLCYELEEKFTEFPSNYKFKIAINGCPNKCSRPQLHDFGINGVKFPTTNPDKCNGVGRIEIAGNNKKMIDDAMRLIKGIVAVPEIGEVYQGKVRSIMPYGAFVEFLPGKDGLLHISEIDWKRLETIEEAGLKEGDDIEVKLLDIDPKTGKFKLSHKVLLPKPEGMGEGNHAKRERKPQQNKEQK